MSSRVSFDFRRQGRVRTMARNGDGRKRAWGGRREAGILTVLLLHASLVSCAGTRTERGGQAEPLRVMTYNIFAGNDLARQSSLARVAALIDTLRADFVLLQEVDRRTARSGGVDQAAVLSERTGMQAVFGRAFEFDGGEFGIAILTRWPVRSWQVVPLEAARLREPAPRAYEARVLLHAIVAAPGGEVHLLNTHLDHQADVVFRHAQVLQILAYAAEHVPRGATIVLGGDLNAVPDAAEIRALGVVFDDAWRACGTGDGFTFRSDNPVRRIDYVLLAGAACAAAHVPDRLLSDHRPVVVDLVRRPR